MDKKQITTEKSQPRMLSFGDTDWNGIKSMAKYIGFKGVSPMLRCLYRLYQKDREKVKQFLQEGLENCDEIQYEGKRRKQLLRLKAERENLGIKTPFWDDRE